MVEARTVSQCLAVLMDMIEEAQAEASDSICLNLHDRLAIVAKRDALTEAKFRLLGQRDESWMRHNRVA